MNHYGITYSKAKHLCQGTRDCENEKAEVHECPLWGTDVRRTLCRCCHECEKECLEMVEDE